MSAFPVLARRLLPAVLIVVWLAIGGAFGPYAGKLSGAATTDQAAFLPRSAESTRVLEAQEAFRQDESLPLVVVWTAEDGGPLSPPGGRPPRGSSPRWAVRPAWWGGLPPCRPRTARRGRACCG